MLGETVLRRNRANTLQSTFHRKNWRRRVEARRDRASAADALVDESRQGREAAPWSPSDVQQGVDTALAFACPGETTGLTLRYERVSFTPIVLLMPEGRDEPCGLIKLSCRLQEKPEDGAETVVVHDRGPAEDREPVTDEVWGEVVSAHVLQIAKPATFPSDLFGRGVSIPPDSALFANCRRHGESDGCLKGLRDLPAQTCAWSGGLMGYLERFRHGLVDGNITRASYDKIRKDPASLAAFGLMTIMDAVNLKDDRRYDHNLFQHESHFVPLDMEGFVVAGLHLYDAAETAQHPLFLRGSGLQPWDVREIFDQALAMSIQMCGSSSGSCRGLLPELTERLAADPLLDTLSASPERVSPPVLCLKTAESPLIRRLGPCCPSRPGNERRLCLSLQVDLPPEVSALGETVPVVVAKLVAARLRMVRDALASMRF